VLQAQRTAGNRAVTEVLIQRDWTGDRTAEVRAQMSGADWNRVGGPWSLLNGHNPDALVGIMRRLGSGGRAQLRAHPVDAAKYDKVRLDFALANAGSRATVGELSVLDAIRNAGTGKDSWAKAWAELVRLGHSGRMTLFRAMDKAELKQLLSHEEDADKRFQGPLDEEINSVIAPPVKDISLLFIPDADELPAPHGGVWPMGEITARVKGKVVLQIPARGGPWVSSPDIANPGHTADPTKAGTFTLEQGKPIVTSAWRFSQLANGTPLKDAGDHVEFERDGKWRSMDKLAKPISRLDLRKTSMVMELLRQVRTGAITAADFQAEVSAKQASGDWGDVPDTYQLNDFGTVGFTLSGSGGDIIHTTPISDDPLQSLLPGDLTFSHGCVHILPADRDKLIEAGVLRGGVKITVRPYDPALLAHWAPPPPPG
jgi:hypothetical protein